MGRNGEGAKGEMGTRRNWDKEKWRGVFSDFGLPCLLTQSGRGLPACIQLIGFI
jgi:hypothetical protein